MSDSKNLKLRVSRAEAAEKIRSQIDRGKELFERQIFSEEEITVLKQGASRWTEYNRMLFDILFGESPLSSFHGLAAYLTSGDLNKEISDYRKKISQWINELESIYEQLERYEELPSNTQHTMNADTMNNENKKIFIGHGGSHIWRELKDFIVDTLELEYEEFNRISPAGRATSDRLKEMLEVSRIAFLVMTGEDEHADNLLHARENVIHEVGLFQGRLGF